MTPNVTVVVTTYRRPHLVARAVRSALAQTAPPLEIVVVDDEPSDAAREAVASVDDDRIRYIAHPHNRGLSAARNTAILAARGDFIAFLDDDDEWAPDKLALQLAAVRPDEPRVITSYELWLRTDGSSTVRDVHLEGDVLRSLLVRDRVHMQTLLVPTEVFDDVGLFDEHLRHHEDMDMAIRLARRCRYRTVPQPLTVIHVTPDSLSTNVANRIAALERLIDKHVEYRCDRRLRSGLLCRLARLHAEAGDADAWRSCLLQALEVWPLNARAAALLAIGTTLSPDAGIRAARFRNQLARQTRRWSRRTP